MTPLHLIKCYDGAQEDDWNRYLLAPLSPIELSAPDFSIVEDRAIYLMIGTRGLDHAPPRFWERLARTRGKGLYHLGDEYLAGGYDFYRHFDFVIRNHWAAGLDRDGVKTVPLGYPCGMASSGDEIAVSKRALAWSFLGHKNADRARMSVEFQPIAPHHLYFTNFGIGHGKIARDDYREILRESAFVPCPMGNAMLETWRLYEALEAAAIPLLIRRPLMAYHDSVIPGHPVPTFSRWSAARRYVEALLADPVHMDDVQHRLGIWWRSYKEQLRSELCDFIERGLAGEFRAGLARWQPGTGIGFQIWRAGELLKHHDLVAVKGRAEMMLAKLARSTGLGGSRLEPVSPAPRSAERKIG